LFGVITPVIGADGNVHNVISLKKSRNVDKSKSQNVAVWFRFFDFSTFRLSQRDLLEAPAERFLDLFGGTGIDGLVLADGIFDIFVIDKPGPLGGARGEAADHLQVGSRHGEDVISAVYLFQRDRLRAIGG